MNRECAGRGRNGQALLEFALILPMLFLLIVNVINFGGMIYAWIVVANAARAGAQYLIAGGAAVGAPAAPSAAAVRALVTADVAALPRAGTAQIRVCVRTGAAVACDGPGSRVPALDAAESGIQYTVGSVEVTYLYQPVLPLGQFPGLGLRPTLPAVTIDRLATMRILQ